MRITQFVVEVLRSSADKPGLAVSGATTVFLADLANVHNPHIPADATTALAFNYLPVSGGDFQVSTSLNLLISGNPGVRNTSLYASAITSMGFGQGGAPAKFWFPTALSTFRVTDSGSVVLVAGPTLKSVSAATLLKLSPAATTTAFHHRFVSALTSIDLEDAVQVANFGLLRAAAFTTITLSEAASEVRDAFPTATTILAMSDSPPASLDLTPDAANTLAFSDLATSNLFWYGQDSGSFNLSGVALVNLGNPAGESMIALNGLADSRVVLPPGGGAPGGAFSSQARGLSQRLGANLSGSYPASYAETPSGLILIANGLDPMVRWDASSGTAASAGVLTPASAISFGGVNVGTIIGKRTAFVRFIDRFGNLSNLSPVSNEIDCGRDQLIDAMQYGAGGAPQVVSLGHGLATGERVIIDGVTGPGFSIANGQWTITVVNADVFTLNGVKLPTSGNQWQGGGRWVMGIQTLGYQAVPVPAEAKVVRRQLLRNLAGDTSTYYVDIDTTDLTSTTFLSTADDETLSGGLAVPLFFDDDLPSANRYGPPPAHKAVVCSHLGRIFAGSDVTVNDGHCEVALDSDQVQGVGTNWPASLAGRMLFVVGASRSYEIESVDVAGQVLTLLDPYADGSDAFGEYAIRPAPAERRFIYYTEPQLPEAWPEWNVISLPEDSDDVVGLMEMSSFLYILEQRHIYKFTFQSDPGTDGFLFRTTNRGCLNDRCWALVEDRAYLLDEIGIHTFDGQDSQPISTPIQNLFRQGESPGLQINWDADQRFWHAAHDPTRETIRWFVAMTGQSYPRHAISYNYRIQRWWIEEYQTAITASTVATIGYRRSLVGSEARRIFCLNEGFCDGVDPASAIRGNVTSSGPFTLTDSANQFPTNLGGASVAIARGPAAGQARQITESSSDTLTIDRPWEILPGPGDVYQVGGVLWQWQSGWFRLLDDEADNARDLELVYQPLKNPANVNVNLFFNHSEEPRTWRYTQVQDGISTVDGSPDIDVDLTTRSGYAMQRMTGHKDYYASGDRHVSVAMSGVQATELVRVYSVTINGVKS